MTIEILKFDTETNCILIERISGNFHDFLNTYKKISDHVSEDL